MTIRTFGYNPATREDLKPGAVFIVRGSRESRLRGLRVALHDDDGTGCPYFRPMPGQGFDGITLCFELGELEVEAPPAAAPTVTIPTEVARAFVMTRLVSGSINTFGESPRRAARDLRAAILAADPTLEHPAEAPELAAARALLTTAGYSVGFPTTR